MQRRERPDFMASPIWERPRNLRFSFSISPNGFAKVILSIIPEHNREIGTCVTQYNALQEVMYKERPKIDAEQQWIETGKAFLALFIAEPEFARKAVEIARRSPRLTCKHATIIRELQLVSDLMVTIKRRIEEIDGTAPPR